jgi:hypothetical protein
MKGIDTALSWTIGVAMYVPQLQKCTECRRRAALLICQPGSFTTKCLNHSAQFELLHLTARLWPREEHNMLRLASCSIATSVLLPCTLTSEHPSLLHPFNHCASFTLAPSKTLLRLTSRLLASLGHCIYDLGHNSIARPNTSSFLRNGRASANLLALLRQPSRRTQSARLAWIKRMSVSQSIASI